MKAAIPEEVAVIQEKAAAKVEAHRVEAAAAQEETEAHPAEAEAVQEETEAHPAEAEAVQIQRMKKELTVQRLVNIFLTADLAK